MCQETFRFLGGSGLRCLDLDFQRLEVVIFLPELDPGSEEGYFMEESWLEELASNFD